LLVAVWSVAAAVADDRLFPSPAQVLSALLAEAHQGELFHHLGVTLLRVGASFILAMAAGSAIGLALGRIALLDRWVGPWVVVLLNIPALVVVILAYVWLGLGETALLAAVAVNKIPNVAITVREGARALERDYAEVATIYRLGLWKRLRHIVIPQLAPYLIAAGRNGLALIWKIVLVVELLGRSDGVGFQLHTAFQMFDVASIFAYSAAFILCVLLIEGLVFASLERRAMRWRR
jgi:NitT/TauT family transport system permease protein